MQPVVNPIVYEFINLAIATQGAFLMFIFCRYLVLEARRRKITCLKFISKYEARVAASFVLICAGATTLRGWTWAVRYSARLGRDVGWMATPPWAYVPVGFALIEIVGLVLLAKAITPQSMAWQISTTLLAGAFLLTLLT